MGGCEYAGHGRDESRYDPTRTFTSHVYSNLDGSPGAFGWDLRGDTFTHWKEESTFTGTLGADGTIFVGAGSRTPAWKARRTQRAYDAT